MVPENPTRAEAKEQLLQCERILVLGRFPHQFRAKTVDGDEAEILANMLRLSFMPIPTCKLVTGLNLVAKSYKLRARIKNETSVSFNELVRVVAPDLERLRVTHFHSLVIFQQIGDEALLPLAVRVARAR